MRKKNEPCRMRTLARSGTAHIQRCVDCNCVALHVGPVTLRFDAGAAESLWRTLGEALSQLSSELRTEVSPSLLGAKTHGSA